MSGKHTPGPWVVSNESSRDVGVRAGSESGKPIALVSKWSSGTERADARLIAAAPDLLEALESLESCLEENTEDPDTVALGIVRAALKKARGE